MDLVHKWSMTILSSSESIYNALLHDNGSALLTALNYFSPPLHLTFPAQFCTLLCSVSPEITLLLQLWTDAALLEEG